MNQERDQLPKVISLITLSFETPFKCLQCCYSFSSLEDYQVHLNANYINNSQEISNLQESYNEQIVNCKPSCPHCNKIFSSVKGINLHIGKVHPIDEKKEKCSRCGNKFNHKYALDFHIKQVHEKSTRMECQKCKKWFYNKYVLQGHLAKCNLFHSLI
ncbi:unnamed protein product [Blepharisma stoltei]|uniref:C2H2-type domain-containing protein n=1 Tax=Blepharisma stoltei TaxID=1481888 RepID=A0AAU9J1L7_9CILI|nr:unnamed protein product [Blepharisma stoltei]